MHLSALIFSSMLHIEFDKEWLNSQSLQDLRTMIRERGLNGAGNKTDMVVRLLKDEHSSEVEIMVRTMKPGAVRKELENMNEFSGGLLEEQRRRLALKLAEISPNAVIKKKEWAPPCSISEVLKLTRPEIAELFNNSSECRKTERFINCGICALSKEEMAQQIVKVNTRKKSKPVNYS